MAETGLPIFDKTIRNTNEWILHVNEKLKLNSRHKAFSSLRAGLHAIRDRLMYDEAVDLGAQLPTLLAGFYYEGWKPSETPVKTRSRRDFMLQIEDEVADLKIKSSSEEIAEVVFQVLQQRISAGEFEDILAMMPQDIEELCLEEVTA